MKLVYGLAKGDTERWQEALLSTKAQTLEQIQSVKDAASKDGFHSFRVADFQDTKSGKELVGMFRKTIK